METLKDRHQLELPDQRNFYLVVGESGGKARRLSLDDIHSEVSRIQLHDGVPECIRSHFAQAQNLAVYSWYYYPFNVTSQFMGFVSVEFALKQKTDKKANFKNLIQEAVEKGWIVDEGFTIARHREGTFEKSYVETLIEAMPKLRNDLAHGSEMLHNNCVASLLICAEFINQLFERPNDSKQTNAAGPKTAMRFSGG